MHRYYIAKYPSFCFSLFFLDMIGIEFGHHLVVYLTPHFQMKYDRLPGIN